MAYSKTSLILETERHLDHALGGFVNQYIAHVGSGYEHSLDAGFRRGLDLLRHASDGHDVSTYEVEPVTATDPHTGTPSRADMTAVAMEMDALSPSTPS